MIIYTKKFINCLSLSITILIYLSTSSLFSCMKNVDFTKSSIFAILKRNEIKLETASNIDNTINNKAKDETQIKKENNNKNTNGKIVEETKNKDIKVKSASVSKNKNTEEWKIIIPCISLEASISEGTSKEVMNKYVGHFEETSKKSGNVGLAAHNRGYAVNYFQNIKKLREGDKITYINSDFKKNYVVEKNIIIKDDDWSYLENTKENKITLITCVENEPEYRRCIQAREEGKK